MKTFAFTRRITGVLGFAVVAAAYVPSARALISEPENLVWGNVLVGGKVVTGAQTNIVVEARKSLSGAPIASYRMGAVAAHVDRYSLAIPLESVNPITSDGVTRVGEQIVVLVHDGKFVRYVTLYTVGSRGKLVRLDLGDVDTDNNGLVDNWERQFFSKTGQDPNGDPDRDGVGNRNEMLGATDPTVPDARHPADISPTNNIISIGEVTAYALAWKTGQPWPVAPTNIPVEFVARAGFIWKNGERYMMDTNNLAAGAPLWWTNLPPDTNVTSSLGLASFNPGQGGVVKRSEIPTAWAGRENLVSRFDDGLELKDKPGRVLRSFRGRDSGNGLITVSLNVQPGPGTLAYAVEETIPEGWVPTQVTGDGVYDAASRRMRWGLFFDPADRILGYKLQRESAGEAPVQVSGGASFDGWATTTSGASIFQPGSTVPQLQGPIGIADGRLRFQLKGEPGLRYEIQVSSDMIHWATESTVKVEEDGQLEFSDEVPQADRQRFYRAKLADE